MVKILGIHKCNGCGAKFIVFDSPVSCCPCCGEKDIEEVKEKAKEVVKKIIEN
ncbi:MAG: hypothetical protein R6U26_02345 [Candidatus Undinarchaeales archaeon]